MFTHIIYSVIIKKKKGEFIMNYAVPSNNIFVTTKKISKKRKMTTEQKKRRDFLRSHYCNIVIDSNTNTPKMEILHR